MIPESPIPELSPLLQVLINIELEQKSQNTRITDIGNKLDNIKEIVALNPTQWRKDTSDLINKMALASGGAEHISPIRKEIYALLEQRFGYNLSTRLTNKKKTLALNGVCKSKIDKINIVDVISDDKKLIEGFLTIVKETAIRYGIAK